MSDGARVGIDLGTTKTVVAVAVDEKTAEILTNRDQETSTPSVISLPRQAEVGSYLVGREAVTNARRDPRNTISSIRRFMGGAFDHHWIRDAITRAPYEVLRDPAGGRGVAVRIGENVMTPEEVSSHILRRVCDDAAQRLARPIAQAVLTVPAYFSDEQMVATRRAGSLAGLSVVALLDEPIAALMVENITEGATDGARILVFDFGGQSLDISLVQLNGTKFAVLGYTGDHLLGGDDVDQAIVKIILEWMIDHDGVIKNDDLKLGLTLKQEAERAKKVLASGVGSTAITINGACRTSSGDLLDVDIDISQGDFARALAPIETCIRGLLKKYMEDKNLRAEDLVGILMIGGTSVIERFRTLLQDVFEGDGKRRVHLAQNPVGVVAQGAALFARSIKGIICHRRSCGHENDIDATTCANCGERFPEAVTRNKEGDGQVVSKLPRSLGIIDPTGDDPDAFRPILKKGSPYPNKEPVWEEFRLPSLGRFEVPIFAGDEVRASQNTPVAIFVIDEGHLPPDVKVGDPVRIGFSYSRDRTLLIDVRYPTSKSTQSPRWKVDLPDGRTPAGDRALQLTRVLLLAWEFLNGHQEYMTSAVGLVLRENMRKAEDAVLEGDSSEVERLLGVLTSALERMGPSSKADGKTES